MVELSRTPCIGKLFCILSLDITYMQDRMCSNSDITLELHTFNVPVYHPHLMKTD